MGKIGSYEYPDIQFGTLLKAVEVLHTKFKGKANDEKTFAESLGHKTNKSGGFLMKLADLRKYGLIEKRGIETTQRAKDIFVFVKPETKKKALNNAIMEIRLWKELYERLETTSPSIEDFKLHLVELTSDTEKVVSQHDNVRNLYIDAMNNFTPNLEINNGNISIKDDKLKDIQQENKQDKTDLKVAENLIVFKSGEVDIQLPKNDTNISILINVLNGMKEKREK